LYVFFSFVDIVVLVVPKGRAELHSGVISPQK
jgi:hypothetical protein